MTKLENTQYKKNYLFQTYVQGFRLGCFTASSKGNTLLNCLKSQKKNYSICF